MSDAAFKGQLQVDLSRFADAADEALKLQVRLTAAMPNIELAQRYDTPEPPGIKESVMRLEVAGTSLAKSLAQIEAITAGVPANFPQGMDVARWQDCLMHDLWSVLTLLRISPKDCITIGIYRNQVEEAEKAIKRVGQWAIEPNGYFIRDDANSAPPPKTLTVSEAAKISGLATGSISRAAASNVISSTGSRRDRRIDRDSFEKWLLERADRSGESAANIEKKCRKAGMD